jgi:hypothetical protein
MMQMEIYWSALGVLAVWRLTHLLVAEDGPVHLAARLRMWAGAGFLGELLGCFYCCSLWIALPLALLIGGGWGERLLLWPALSAGAILLQRLTDSAASPPPAIYAEDAEEEDRDVLRQGRPTIHEHADNKSRAAPRAVAPRRDGSRASRGGLPN